MCNKNDDKLFTTIVSYKTIVCKPKPINQRSKFKNKEKWKHIRLDFEQMIEVNCKLIAN